MADRCRGTRKLFWGLALVLAGCGDGNGGGGDGGTRDTRALEAYRADWAGTCDPVDQTCSGGQDCVLTCPSGEFACQAATGTKNDGDECNVNECKRGLICVLTGTVGRCRKWCKEDFDCGARTCLFMGVTCPPGTTTYGRLCTP